MTPFLNLERLSGPEATDRAPKVSSSSEGGMGKQFLEAYTIKSIEPSGDEAIEGLQIFVQSSLSQSDQNSAQFFHTVTKLNVSAPDAEQIDTDLLTTDVELPPEETQTLLVNSTTIDPASVEDETEIQPGDLDEISDEPVLAIDAKNKPGVPQQTPEIAALSASPSGTDAPAAAPGDVANAADETSGADAVSRTPAEFVVPGVTGETSDSEKIIVAEAPVPEASSGIQAPVSEAEAAELVPESNEPAKPDQPEAPGRTESPATPALGVASNAQVSTVGEQNSGSGDTTPSVSSLGTSSPLPASPAPVLTQVTATPTSVQMQQAPANYVAVPDDIASIISQELSSDTQNSRVRIQLDPPELGRVSLEFKFDSQGLQHVVVTADSAEAIRRIRAFHPDLVATLEQHGLSGSDMTFQQKQSQQNSAQNWQSSERSAAGADADPSESESLAGEPRKSSNQLTTTGLDIRV